MKETCLVALAILLLAFTIRVAFVNYASVAPLGGGDGQALETMGINILKGQAAYSGEGYAFRPPGFPFIVAQVYRFGQNHRNIYLAQSLLGALSAMMLFLVLLRFNLAVAIVSSLIFSFHPLMLLFTKQLLTENTHIFLMLLITLLAFRTLDNKVWALALGCVWGLLILTRSEGTLTVAPILVGIAILAKRNRLFKSAIPLLIAAIVVSPWVYRNYKLLGHATLNTAGGLNFYMSFNPNATGGFYQPEQLADAPNGEAERSAFYFRKGLSFIREHPARAVTLAGHKQAHLWESFHNRFLDLADIGLLPISLVGMLLAIRKREHLLLLAPIIGITSVFFIFEAESRYRAPMYPFLISFAAVALVRVYQQVVRPRLPKNVRVVPET